MTNTFRYSFDTFGVQLLTLKLLVKPYPPSHGERNLNRYSFSHCLNRNKSDPKGQGIWLCGLQPMNFVHEIEKI